MGIHAKLYIDEEEYTVLNFNFDLQKRADANGRPTTKYTGGLFNFTIESTKKLDIMLWSLHPTQMKKVELVISPAHLDGKSRKITLGDAICLSFTNEYFSTDNQPLKEYFTVSPGYMLQNGLTIFEKNWKVTDLELENTEATLVTEVLPNLIDYHYEDEGFNKINKDEINIDDIIYLVINSENAIGEEITINLDDNFKDYEHNGKPIKNDLLENIILEDDFHKVKLKAIKQAD